MDGGGTAFGAGKAGAPFDPITFAQRPQVILRAVCLLFGIIVFGCISAEGWLFDKGEGREVCLYNKRASACQYGESIGFIAFLASAGFLVGEYLFEQMSSVKTRKHYVLGDLGFSAFWAFLYFIAFCYLWNQWSNAETPPDDYGVNNARAAIFFSFLSVFTWAGCAWFAYQRYTQGIAAMFGGAGFDGEANMGGTAAAYSSYSQDEQMYQDPPFSNNQMGSGEYPAPTY